MISTLVELLSNFYARNDFTNVEAIARSLLAAIPNDQVSLQFLGLAYYRSGRIKDAINIFDKVVHRRKPQPELEAKHNDTGLSHGDLAAAVCYQEATRLNPNLSQAWLDLGSTLLALDKHEQAIPAFRSALIAQPESTQAMLALGQTALHVADLATAEDAFTRLRELQPNNIEAYRGLGRIYRKRRDFATARACFVRVRMLQGNRIGIENLTRRDCSGHAR